MPTTAAPPPCADALIDAGVARVVVALDDPDPKVAGGDLARLRDAGVEVEVGIEAEAAADVLAPYLVHRRTGRPYVVLKLAATLDGRTAAPDGTSRWITGPRRGPTPTPCEPRATPSSSAPAPSAPTTRPSPSATRRPPAATRSAWSSATLPRRQRAPVPRAVG